METEWTLDEVRGHGPSAEGPMVLTLLGIVYDVSSGREFFGPSGPYRVYTGHDATFALATMSMRSTDLDVFDYKLDADSREALADWLAYFDVKYGRAGRCVDVVHPIDFCALPQGKDPTAFIGMSHPAVDSGKGDCNAAAAAAFSAVAAEKSREAPAAAHAAPTSDAHEHVEVERRAKGAVPRPRLSQILLAATADLREKLLKAGANGAVLRKRLSVREYASWLAAKGQVYSELEGRLDLAADAPVSKALRSADDARLRRLPAILQDLAALAPAHTAREWPTSPAASRYAQRVADVAAKPHLFVVHVWVRYGAGLAHGPLMRKALMQGLGLKPVGGRCPGLLYHDFGSEEELRALADVLVAGVDGVAAECCVGAREAEEMVLEARRALELELDLNDEFDPQQRFPKL